MNPFLVAQIVARNGSDIEAIVSTIGITNLLKLAPQFMAVAETAVALMQQEKEKGR
jgi:hypothetical protein